MLNKFLKVFLPDSDQRKNGGRDLRTYADAACDDRSVPKQL